MGVKVDSIPGEMKAVQVVEYKKPHQINTVATPKELGDYDILVKTAVASLCHTDSMVQQGKQIKTYTVAFMLTLE